MNPQQPLWMGIRESRNDVAAPVAPLGGEPRTAEHVAHQLGEEIGHLGDAESRLSGRERERVPRQGRGDDGERVGGVAAVARRVGEPRDQLVGLHTDPGQPCTSSSGVGCGPTPGWRM